MMLRALCLFFSINALLTAYTTQVLAVNKKAHCNLLDLHYSPSAYECAILSEHVYRDDLQEGDQVVVTDKSLQIHALHSWTVYKTFQEQEDGLLSRVFQQLGLPYGYRGVLYLNTSKKQAVLAHRGTDPSNMSSLKTDALSIANNAIGGQERLVPQLLKEALVVAQQEHCSLTVTGHSLGGWLAQLTAFIAKDQYPEYHVKAITFDAPGARPMLEQINSRISPIDLNYLDITNYLSSPNLINACNPHLGTIYRVVFDPFSNKTARYTLESHAMDNFLRAFDPQTGQVLQCVFVKDWPVVSKKSLETATKAVEGLVADHYLKSFFYLFTLFKKCAQQEALGEYSGFFKFANATNHYHTSSFALEGEDSFDLAYKYHYRTKPFDPAVLHVRHLPEAGKSFLIRLQRGVTACKAAAEEEPILKSIIWDQEQGFLRTSLYIDIQLVVDKLMGLMMKYPELHLPTNLPLHLTTSNNSLLPPPAVPFFVGRDKFLKKITSCFDREEPLIIAPPITGPGGIGKSQLALKAMAQKTAKKSYDYIFWIPAESEKKLSEAYLRIAEGLGIYIDKKDIKQIVEQVQSYLRERHCLYVFDDTPDIESIQSFLPLVRGHILITSRNSSAASWPKANPPLRIEPLSKQEALALARDFGYGETEEERNSLEALLSKLPCYPLSLVQLYSVLKEEGHNLESFQAIMRGYDPQKQDKELFKLLDENSHMRVGYGKSMLYVFKASLEKLVKETEGNRAIELLSKLAYLDPKGVPVDWLLTWDTADLDPLKRQTRAALSLLEKYSLVQWDRATRQVYVHAETQLMVRELNPQFALTNLINSLVDYVGDEAMVHQNATKWTELLPHGRMLFTRLVIEQCPYEAYRLTKYLARACKVSCLYQEEVNWAKERLSIAQQCYSNQDHPEVAASLDELGSGLWVSGEYQKALEYYKQTLAMRQRLHEEQIHPQLAKSFHHIGLTLMELGQYPEALAYAQQALEMFRKLYPNQNHPDLARSLNNMGYILMGLGKYRVALEYNKQALTIRQKLYPDQAHPHTARSLNNVGWSLLELGSYQEALERLEQAQAMLKQIYKNQDHPYLAWYANNKGDVLIELGEYEAALDYQKQALVIRKRLYNDQAHSHIARSLSHVGHSLDRLGKYEEALEYHKEALAMFEYLYEGRYHPSTAQALKNMGENLMYTGAFQESLAYYQQALDMQKCLYDDQDHPWIADTLYNMAETLKSLGRAAEAIDCYQKAVAIALRAYQQEHPHVNRYLNSLVKATKELEAYSYIQNIQDEVLPLCIKWLGENHLLTEQLKGSKLNDL